MVDATIIKVHRHDGAKGGLKARLGRSKGGMTTMILRGLIADLAFDSNTIIADLNERGAKIVISQHPRRALPLPPDLEYQVGVISSRTSFARVQAYRHASWQNRAELQCYHPSRSRRACLLGDPQHPAKALLRSFGP
ncbi:hypothetical protein [Mesorhizobium australicum]|uniref:hypothetical protein n=1 Tax=Mesorhizobium australicum TaxID=536018 RepID=UPI003EB71174